MTIDPLTTEQIAHWPTGAQQHLQNTLAQMFREAFPRTSDADVRTCVNYVFTVPGTCIDRQVLMVRERSSQLVAIMIWDQRVVEYGNERLSGMYVLLRVVIPQYQGMGLGNRLIANVINTCQPDVLLTTCAQSASLHSWGGLLQKRYITGFEVYPRLEYTNHKPSIVLVPSGQIDFVRAMFSQLYAGVVDENSEKLETAVSTLTDRMVRKDVYEPQYDFFPWKKQGREDELARALGVTETDGVLVMVCKIM